VTCFNRADPGWIPGIHMTSSVHQPELTFTEYLSQRFPDRVQMVAVLAVIHNHLNTVIVQNDRHPGSGLRDESRTLGLPNTEQVFHPFDNDIW
jgi:hypothetical protein